MEKLCNTVLDNGLRLYIIGAVLVTLVGGPLLAIAAIGRAS